MDYELTRADRAPFPARYATEPRYLKYRPDDDAKPWARFFRPRTLPVQPHVVEALVAGMSPTEYGYRVEEAADRLSQIGRAHV